MPTSRKPNERDRQRGRELAQRRKAAGMSQEKLAELLHISTYQLGKYERGQTRMSANRYEAAITILDAQETAYMGFREDAAVYESPSTLKGDCQRAIDLMGKAIAQRREAEDLFKKVVSRL
jgi:transcriptional regulator with XRE-family HTH domain